jgi:hypothetical protein
MRSRSLVVAALAVTTACLDSSRYTHAPDHGWSGVGSVRWTQRAGIDRLGHVGLGGAL